MVKVHPVMHLCRPHICSKIAASSDVITSFTTVYVNACKDVGICQSNREGRLVEVLAAQALLSSTTVPRPSVNIVRPVERSVDLLH